MNKSFGAQLLIAGCCIGAGMLGLPIATGSVGFLPSSMMFFVAWAYMVLTGLVLMELVVSYKHPVNLVTMAQDALGVTGRVLAFVLFIFLFYAIMVAYFIAGSVLIRDALALVTGLVISPVVSGLFLAVCLFTPIFLGVRSVDRFNRVIMTALFVSYAILLVFGVPHIHMEFLDVIYFRGLLAAIPIMILSFGYHNLVPSLAAYLQFEKKALIKAIIVGSLIPLVIYLLWEFVILGIVPHQDALWHQAKENGEIVTEVLQKACHSQFVVHNANTFAFLAIISSLLPVAFSCSDFLKDAFCIGASAMKRASIALLVILPPCIIAFTYPAMFLRALSYAGGVCAVQLFGTLPACMVFQRRKQLPHHFRIATPLVLWGIIIVSFAVSGMQILHDIGRL